MKFNNCISVKSKLHKSSTMLCVLFIYILAATISFLFSLLTGTYNGDFMLYPVSISNIELILIYISTLIPLLFLYYLYMKKCENESKFRFSVSPKTLIIFAWVIIFISILNTVLFGVGNMLGEEKNTAPSYLKPFIQILNRFDPLLVVGLCFFALNGMFKHILLFLSILIIAYLRGSLGICFTLFLFSFIRYDSQIKDFVKKYFVVILLFLYFVPTIIFNLYYQRALLRGDDTSYENFSGIFILTGWLAGRLSSFTNTAYIMENYQQIDEYVEYLSPFYLQQNFIAGLFSSKFMTNVVPEKLIYGNFFGADSGLSLMLGIPGNMIFSYMKSSFIFVLNAISYIFIIKWLYGLITLIRIPYINEYAFILLSSLVVSGVPLLFGATFIKILVLYISLDFISRRVVLK